MTRIKSPNNIVYISTFPPRECGIATFTKDLAQAFDQKYNPVVKSRVIALNEHPTVIYDYDNYVFSQLPANDLESYVALAKKLNRLDNVKIINIQHEFGLFGGDWGNYIIPFLQVIEKPVVTTFHSVLPLKENRYKETDIALKKLVTLIAQKSCAIVVMNKLSQQILENEYNIARSKIHLIPHGIPQTQFEPSDQFKKLHNLEGHTVLSTFGLLSPNKGIEYAIRALPKIIKSFPEVTYLILGVTHPNIRKWDGEVYRNFLMKEAEKMNLKNNVRFYNKYLTLEELLSYLKATDVYIAPAKDQGQSVSGTISYALGCGRPVVSTASIYARYIINDQNGILVKPKSHNDISKAVLSLLNDPRRIRSMSAGAYELSRKMIWPNVASEYFRIFRKFSDIRHEDRKLPKIKFDHIMRLSDDFGMLQFAKYSKPLKRYGYTLDDNARALIACADYYGQNQSAQILNLAYTYLKFFKFTQRASGTFANLVTFKRNRDTSKDEDVQGRAIWALGYIISCSSLPEDMREQAEIMLKKTFKLIQKFESSRAIAFSIIGLYHYYKYDPKRPVLKLIEKLGDYQIALYKNYSNENWKWFEDHLTYSNSKLPESLFYAYKATRKQKYLNIAERSLDFLTSITFKDSMYWPIGQNGWYFKDKVRAYFDQQPEDTASMVQTKVLAHEITKNATHLENALTAFQWFLGGNHLNQMVYDESTGGCNDGIHQNRINLNQGAESTISYLLARLAIEKAI